LDWAWCCSPTYCSTSAPSASGEAEEHIAEELASLDPIARAQVLKSVGEQQLGAVFGS